MMKLLLGIACLALPPVGVAADTGMIPDTAPQTAASETAASAFYPFQILEDEITGPPDQSNLNRALRPQDRLHVRSGHFMRVGNAPAGASHAPDERVRLFGVNLSFAANFPPEDEARQRARTLRRLGFNAVRLHHLDTHLDDSPDSPQGILTSGPYPTFNATAVRRLRHFIQALSDEGIYVNLNLHVGYQFRPAIDGLPAVDDDSEHIARPGTPIHVYYPDLIDKQMRYARELIQALGLAQNPALAMVEINNESSLLDAWQSPPWHAGAWRATLPAPYADVLQARWHDWVLSRYGTLEAACRAWNRCGDPEVTALPARGMLAAEDTEETLIERAVRQVTNWADDLGWGWKGPSAALPASQYRRDFLAFLVQVDRAYFRQMRQAIREAAGVDVPVTGTQMSYGGILNFDSQADMDYLDHHLYIGHPVYTGGIVWQTRDWRIPDLSSSGAGMEALLSLSLVRAQGKPTVVSEFNQPFPSAGGPEILPLMATIASLQDWDGLFFFDYHNDLSTRQSPGGFSLTGNWGQVALAGQSARLFREFHIPRLETLTLLPLSAHQRLEMATRKTADNNPLALWMKHALGSTPRLAWKTRLALDLAGDRPAPQLQEPDTTRTPDASVRHEASETRVVLDTDNAWGVFGQLDPADEVQGRYFKLKSAASGPQAVQILATPLDDERLSHARRFLLTLGSYTTGTQSGSRPPRPKQVVPYPEEEGWLTLEPEPGDTQPSGLLDTQPPAWMKRMPIMLGVPTAGRALRVRMLDDHGNATRTLAADTRVTDAHTGLTWITLQTDDTPASPWYELILGDKE